MELSRHVQKEYEVVVVGGGMAGVCAAIAAARLGAKTAIIQARPVFGGNASSEIRMHILGAGCHNGKANMLETGILMEILLENKRRNPYHNFSIWDSVLWEKVRFQKGLDSYLNTSMTQAKKDGNRITSITCYQSSTETTYEISASIFIDATGHGTLGKLVGAELLLGSESKAAFGEPNAPDEPNEYTLGSTLLYKAVDRGEPVKFIKPFWAYTFTEEDLRHREHSESVFARSDGGIPVEFSFESKGDEDAPVLPQTSEWTSGHWWIELGGNYQDIIGHDEIIRDELLKCVFGVWDHIKNQGDHGAENYDLEWVGFVPGYRESRRLKGPYLLTENDVRANRIFEDAVAYGGWPMDEHTPGGIKDVDKQPARILNFPGAYTIPYRCYYSSNIENLMMAGRNISTTKMAFGTIRVMGTCAVGGQAVGTAAALAIKHNCTPAQIGNHMEELQQQLLKDDCFIPGYKNNDPKDLARKAVVKAGSFKEKCEPSNVINGISRSWKKESNMWESINLEKDNAKLSLFFEKPEKIFEVRITFDPNLSREIMPTINSGLIKHQVKGLPLELVKDYTVTLYREGQVVYTKSVENNYQRHNILSTTQEGVLSDRLEITVHSTYGYDAARIFEVRAY